jgi:outer membrane protein OmpA-like peptidoglycan-associated protein
MIKKGVADAAKNMAQDDANAAAIKAMAAQKLYEEKIDTTINNRIDTKLSAWQRKADSIKTVLSVCTKMLSEKHFSRNYKKIVSPLWLAIKAYNEDAATRVKHYKMVIEGLSIADKQLYELAAFFGPGKYVIPQDKMQQANTMFTPLTDSLIAFANRYSQTPQSGTIVINGYADATNVTAGSQLYNELVAALQNATADKAALNKQLSQFRADAIGDLIGKLVIAKSSSFTAWNQFALQLYEYGQGETLPTKTIKDYKEDDARRRVVLIYWCVLPTD